MAKEEAFFTINDVLDALSNKLIGRHPHVFGNVKAEDAQQVLKNWEALKKEEKQRKAASNGKKSVEQNEPGLLDAVSRKMPSLMEAQKISSKAAHVGFDWPDLEGIFEKLAEETEELREHVHELPRGATAGTGGAKIPPQIHARLEDELGDLFFVVVNLARRLSIDPESALRRTNRKFRQRFGWLESELRKHGKTPEHATLDEMESLWQQAKTFEEGGR
jgi:MazG family protein